jgi:transcriptional regulator with XRE-family HTH domain
MGGERESLLARREIAYRLREAASGAGLIGRELAQRLGRDEPTISHWLRATRPIREADIGAVLTTCAVPRAEWDDLLRLIRTHPAPTSILLRGDRQHSGYRDHLADARTVVEVAATHLPRLAHTAGYAHAWEPERVMAAGDLGLLPRSATSGVNGAAGRWRGPEVTLLVHEATLRAPVGLPAVMVEQRSRLRWLSSLPYVQVRLVAGLAHTSACTAGSFILARYGEHRPVVLRHEPGGLVVCDDPDYVADHEQTLARLLALAWDTKRTAHHIWRLDTETEIGTGERAALLPMGGEA